MLTERAERYLARLQRIPPVPVSTVEKVIRDRGQKYFDSWLSFHDRYAGYVEPLGRDTAIWGIVHAQSHWIKPGHAIVEKEPHENVWYVTCAEVHPSYNYLLDDQGEFLGRPAQSFDIKVERNAILDEFVSSKQSKFVLAEELRQAGLSAASPDDFRRHLIEAASDKYFRYYVTEPFLLVEDVEDEKFIEGWRHL
jgi:hypothetical protein